MIRGMYTAASGMISTLTANDTLANNLANVSTVGFKRNGVNFQAFPEMLIQKIQGGNNQELGGISTGNKLLEARIDFTQGAVTETGNTFDMAIHGDGFFKLRSPEGQIYYTRAGNFTVNNQGFLVTQAGDFVQGMLGDIQFNLDEGQVRVSKDGSITVGERNLDKLVITRFQDNRALEKAGDTKFQESQISEILPEALPGEDPGYQVYQGKLERGNTNVITELVNSIQGMRLYEALQRNIRFHNEALEKTVNEVGRYR